MTDHNAPTGTGADMTTDPFKPSISLLMKLGSAVVHADEMLLPGGHEFDRVALLQILDDPEVKTWIAQMTKKAMLPVKR